MFFVLENRAECKKLKKLYEKKSLFVVGGFAISFMSWHFYYRGLLQDDLVVPQFLWSVRLIRCVSEVIIGAMAYELT